jgi:hypothetical protein
MRVTQKAATLEQGWVLKSDSKPPSEAASLCSVASQADAQQVIATRRPRNLANGNAGACLSWTQGVRRSSLWV